jgi:hypothetical protein
MLSAIMSDVSPLSEPVNSTLMGEFTKFVKWCGENPVAVAVGVALLGTLAFFFG